MSQVSGQMEFECCKLLYARRYNGAVFIGPPCNSRQKHHHTLLKSRNKFARNIHTQSDMYRRQL